MKAEVILSSGRTIDIFDEKGILSLAPMDIVNGLEKLRYNGHRYYLAQNLHYSVLDHSIAISDYLTAMGQDFIQAGKLALVHDFSEAFIPDIPSPIKAVMKFNGEATIQEWENWVMRLWCEKLFGFKPMEYHYEIVKNMDTDIVPAEMAILFGTIPTDPNENTLGLHSLLQKRMEVSTEVRRNRNIEIVNFLFNNQKNQ